MNRSMLNRKKTSNNNQSQLYHTEMNSPHGKMIGSRLPFSTPNLNQEKIIKNIMLNPGTFLNDCKNIQQTFSGDSFVNLGYTPGYARRKTASGSTRVSNYKLPKSQAFYKSRMNAKQAYGSQNTRFGQKSREGEFDMPNIYQSTGSTLSQVGKQDFYAISNANKRFRLEKHDSAGITSSRQNIS